METNPRRVKAWCPRCYMTFEAGKNSVRATKHLAITNCDAIPCRRSTSGCVRRFSNTNAANRHTYCFTMEEVSKWDQNLCIQDNSNTLSFEKLTISDVDDMLNLEEYRHFKKPNYQEGPPFKYKDCMALSELFGVLRKKLGEEFPREDIDKFQEMYRKYGYSTIGAIRAAKDNQGSWEFLYKDFCEVGPSVTGFSHVVKKLLSKKANN